jgi:CRP-like cAMP-binding protein
VPVSYELLFIVINAYYALRGYIAEMPVELEDLERRVYEACFQPFGLSARQFVKILEEAEWHVASDGETLCVQGEPVTDVFVPISGAFSIVTRERGVVAPIGLFSLVGEVSLLENLQSEGGAYHRCAIASMVAEAGATYVRWPQRCFYELMSSDADFGKAMQVLISRALSKKLMQLWETDRGAAPERSPPPAAQPERSGPPAAAAAATRAGSEPPSRSGGAPM